MRTTVNIPDGLLEQAKRAADREGGTLSDVVERALRDHLLRRGPRSSDEPFRLTTFGKGGLRPGVSFDRLKDFADDEDAARVLRGTSDRAAEEDGADDAPPRR
ncbi:MAG TPA: hypothetical protein VHJ20_01925 [Polyangia bacterium]|nr:hypothetical protein [Polyangia bacterium]